MKLSVIIPGFGARRVDSLAQAERIRHALAGEDAEVLVPDGITVGAARNAGLQMACGEFLVWVDGDDELPESWYELMRRVLHGNADFDLQIFRFAVRDGARLMVVEFPSNVSDGVSLVGAILREDIPAHCCNKILRRSLWRGVHFDESLVTMEDALVLPRVIERAERVVFNPTVAYIYCVNPHGLVRSNLVGCAAEAGVRAALRRADEWSNTPFAADARFGAAVHFEQYLEAQMLLGRQLDAFAQEARRYLRVNFLNLMCTRKASFRRKAKLALAAWNGWVLQRLFWKFHGVRYENRVYQ